MEDCFFPQFQDKDSNLDREVQGLACCQLHHPGEARVGVEPTSAALQAVP